MSKILLGHKLGMTQMWDDKGRLVSATVISATPNIIIKDKDQTLIGIATSGKTTKAQAHIAKKVGSKRGIWVKQIPALDSLLTGEASSDESANHGVARTDQQTLDVTQFEIGEPVKIAGVTKGKGFAGTIKRHNFHRGPVSHGSDNVRRPGSIGAQRPQRVPKGQKMAGRLGGVNFTMRGGKVLAIDGEQNLLIVSGNIPGPRRGKVVVETQ